MITADTAYVMSTTYLDGENVSRVAGWHGSDCPPTIGVPHYHREVVGARRQQAVCRGERERKRNIQMIEE